MKWIRLLGFSVLVFALVILSILIAIGAVAYGSAFVSGQMGMALDDVLLDTAVAFIVFMVYLVVIPVYESEANRHTKESNLVRPWFKGMVALFLTGMTVPILVALGGYEGYRLPMAAGVLAPVFGWLMAGVLESMVDGVLKVYRGGWRFGKAEEGAV